MRKYSFLIPVYNVGKLLNRCAESVLAQTYTNFEVIFYDDCSTDDSLKRCKKYAYLYPDKIRVISGERNIGLLRNRIELMEHAKVEVIIFLDSDDDVKKEMLSVLEETFQKYDCDMIVFDSWSQYNILGIPFKKCVQRFDGTEIYEKDKKALYNKFAEGMITSIWRKAFKKDLFSFPYSDELRNTVSIGEDILFSMPLLQKAKKTVCVNKKLYIYCANPKSLTRAEGVDRLKNSLRDHRLVLEQFETYAEKWDVNKAGFYEHMMSKVKGFLYAILLFDDEKLKKELYDEVLGIHAFRIALEQHCRKSSVYMLFLKRDYRGAEALLQTKKKKMKLKKQLRSFLLR